MSLQIWRVRVIQGRQPQDGHQVHALRPPISPNSLPMRGEESRQKSPFIKPHPSPSSLSFILCRGSTGGVREVTPITPEWPAVKCGGAGARAHARCWVCRTEDLHRRGEPVMGVCARTCVCVCVCLCVRTRACECMATVGPM